MKLEVSYARREEHGKRCYKTAAVIWYAWHWSANNGKWKQTLETYRSVLCYIDIKTVATSPVEHWNDSNVTLSLLPISFAPLLHFFCTCTVSLA